MGQYFVWVNIDKKERLGFGPFSGMVKKTTACSVGNPDTDAACTLIADRWKGDTVVYLGDETDDYWPDKTPEALAYRAKWGTVYQDYIDETFSDVAGLFKAARGLTHTDYTSEDSRTIPYNGPFELDIIHYRFVINHSRHLFFDRMRTPISWISKETFSPGRFIVRFDPFSALLQKTSYLLYINETDDEYFEEDWIGDAIEFSHDSVPKGYTDISRCYSDRGNIVADDAAILRAIESQEYLDLINAGVDEIFALEMFLRKKSLS